MLLGSKRFASSASFQGSSSGASLLPPGKTKQTSVCQRKGNKNMPTKTRVENHHPTSQSITHLLFLLLLPVGIFCEIRRHSAAACCFTTVKAVSNDVLDTKDDKRTALDATNSRENDTWCLLDLKDKSN